MNKFTKKKHFIGVDISKDVLDVSILNEEDLKAAVHFQITNDLKGFSNLLVFLQKKKISLKECAFCMEHTGTYGLLFFAWLSQQDILFCVESGLHIKRSLGLTRGKNDKVDAERIAEYACLHKSKLITYQMPSTLMVKIKQLLTYRDQMVRLRSGLKNSLKSHKQYQTISGLENITQELEQQIISQDQIIKSIENQLLEVIKSESQLKKNYKLVTSVKGIGLVIAAAMITTTNNFQSFDNGRKYACYAGIAPFEYTSGSSIRGKNKVSSLGNKRIKTLLTNGANTAIQWDPQLKTYYNRKVAEGKDHKVIVNAVSCKLVNRVFAVVKRQTPYVSIYEQNFS